MSCKLSECFSFHLQLHVTSDVVFPEKYFLGNFPENFWKFSEEKENIPHYLIYQKKL